MFVIGVLVGFRPDGGVPRIVLALLLILGFAHALSWIFANVGLRASNAEAAQAISFPILFPLTFASSAFVPVSNMPGWLQAFAWHQPVTIVVNTARALMLGPELPRSCRRKGSSGPRRSATRCSRSPGSSASWPCSPARRPSLQPPLTGPVLAGLGRDRPPRDPRASLSRRRWGRPWRAWARAPRRHAAPWRRPLLAPGSPRPAPGPAGCAAGRTGGW